jgi:hypothetical protein
MPMTLQSNVFETIRAGYQWETVTGGTWTILKVTHSDVWCIIAWPEGSYDGPFRRTRNEMTSLIIRRKI